MATILQRAIVKHGTSLARFEHVRCLNVLAAKAVPPSLKRSYHQNFVSTARRRAAPGVLNIAKWGATFQSPRRHFSGTCRLRHGDITAPRPGEELHVTFVTKEGEEFTYEVAEGDNLLDIAQHNDLEMEGACGGSCACSTCHVIVEDQDIYDKLEEPDDDENDMLDLAFGLTETSRLGCQVKMAKDIDGIKVRLPSMTRNLQSSDFEKK